MRIDEESLKGMVRLRLQSGEILYCSECVPEGDAYMATLYFGGEENVSESDIAGYENFRADVLAAKVKRDDDLTNLCEEDPVFHVKVLEFMCDVLAEALAEKADGTDYTKKTVVLRDAEKTAREKLNPAPPVFSGTDPVSEQA